MSWTLKVIMCLYRAFPRFFSVFVLLYFAAFYGVMLYYVYSFYDEFWCVYLNVH